MHNWGDMKSIEIIIYLDFRDWAGALKDKLASPCQGVEDGLTKEVNTLLRHKPGNTANLQNHNVFTLEHELWCFLISNFSTDRLSIDPPTWSNSAERVESAQFYLRWNLGVINQPVLKLWWSKSLTRGLSASPFSWICNPKRCRSLFLISCLFLKLSSLKWNSRWGSVAGFQTFSSIPFTIPWNFFETLLMVVCNPAPPWITPDTEINCKSRVKIFFSQEE